MKTKKYLHVLTNDIPDCSYWSNILKRDLGLLYLLVQINGHQDHQVPLGRPVCQLFQRWFWVNYAGQHQVPDHLLAVEQHVQQWRPDPECHQRLGRENLPGNEDFAVWWNQVNSFFLCFISCIFNVLKSMVETFGHYQFYLALSGNIGTGGVDYYTGTQSYINTWFYSLAQKLWVLLLID